MEVAVVEEAGAPSGALALSTSYGPLLSSWPVVSVVVVVTCCAARPIARGKRLAFAMQLRVPNDAPLGGNGLFWALDPFGTRGPQVHARVTVDR
jgi:hypothetical protein